MSIPRITEIMEPSVPISGEALTVAGAGVVALTIPEGAKIAVITNPSVAIRIAFGTVASATVGTLCPADSNPEIVSAAALAAASIYWTAAATGPYVQYYK